jgi:hypothetical protein
VSGGEVIDAREIIEIIEIIKAIELTDFKRRNEVNEGNGSRFKRLSNSTRALCARGRTGS